MKRLAAIASIFLILPGLWADDAIAWGAAVNGLQLGISPSRDANSGAAIVHLRNVSEKTISVFPSIYGCLAVGSGGARLASQLELQSADTGKKMLLNYAGLNHLWGLDQRAVYGKSAKEIIGKNPVSGADLQLEQDDAHGLAIELAPGESTRDPVDYTPGKERKSLWQGSESVPPGNYHVSVRLIIDQEHSAWKGVLTTGRMKVDLGKFGE